MFGLPLARLFTATYSVVGFDINEKRILKLKKGIDTTQEVENELLKNVLVDTITTDKGFFVT